MAANLIIEDLGLAALDQYKKTPVVSLTTPAAIQNNVLRVLGDGILRTMDADFAAWYSVVERPLIAAERLLRASLLQVLYTIRSARQRSLGSGNLGNCPCSHGTNNKKDWPSKMFTSRYNSRNDT
jgi:hypothetical protein